jgi:TonB family protein
MGASAASMMPQAWKQWTGQVVASEFVLKQFLFGSAQSGVFLTERRGAKAIIKLVPEDGASSDLRFSRWELAASLSHPRLLRLFERGRCQLGNHKLLYLVTEFTDENLAELLPERALTAEEAGEMVRSLIDVLGWLHDQGLVHGRIRPSNIMAQGDLLKLSSESICPVGGSAIALKPPSMYDAPELAKASLSPASDIWSFGVLLVESFTQKLPALDSKQGRDPVLPAGLSASAIPARFAEIVRNCLRRDPERRWTIEQVRKNFERSSNGVKESPPKATMVVEAKPAAVVASAAPSWRPFAVPGVLVAIVAGAVVLRQVESKKPADPSDFQPKVSNRLSTAAQVTKTDKPLDSVQPTSPPAPKLEKPAPAAVPKPSPAPETAQQKPTQVPANTPPANKTVKVADQVATLAPEPSIPESPASTSHPGVLHEVTPDVPRSARNTITGTVRVRVHVNVDKSGNVTEAKLEDSGPSAYFARISMKAAQDWKFAAGNATDRAWRLHFQFRRNGTRVVPELITK